MNCKNCGAVLGAEQKFCPNCGTPVVVEEVSTPALEEVPMPNIPNSEQSEVVATDMPQTISEMSIPSGFENNLNNSANQASTDVGFNPSGANLDYVDSNDVMPSSPPVPLVSNIPTNNSPVNSPAPNNGMFYGNLDIGDGSKKKFPWVTVAIILVVVMLAGVFVLPMFNNLSKSTYEGDQYSFQYNANWKIDEEQDKMTLFYSDNNSRFMFNALSTFGALNSSIASDAARKQLYTQFYNAWSGIEGGELTGGTDTFLDLTTDTLYARVDYVITGKGSVGSFYVIVSEKNDKVISFMTYCTPNNKDKIDKDVVDMLKTVTYKREADSSVYDKFTPGTIREYAALGYMSYDVPECWQLDESRTKSVQYKSNIFRFQDDISLLDVKAVTPFNSVTGTPGTTYESMKAIVAKSYGSVKEEKTKTISGKVWYILITPDYTAGGKSYHNEIYFTMSATNKHLYYIEGYFSNDTSEKKTKYMRDSIEYIIESATLLKVTE